MSVEVCGGNLPTRSKQFHNDSTHSKQEFAKTSIHTGMIFIKNFDISLHLSVKLDLDLNVLTGNCLLTIDLVWTV